MSISAGGEFQVGSNRSTIQYTTVSRDLSTSGNHGDFNASVLRGTHPRSTDSLDFTLLSAASPARRVHVFQVCSSTGGAPRNIAREHGRRRVRGLTCSAA